MTDPLTREQLDALGDDFQRQLDRTRQVSMEPLISINAEYLRALIAAAKERDELRGRDAIAEAERRGRIAELTLTIDGIVDDLATARQDSAHSAVLALDGLREVLTARLAELDPQPKDT